MALTTKQADALAHIRDNCQRAALVARRVGTQERLVADWEEQYLLARCLEIIGEATGRLGPQFYQAHPAVEWRKMAGMRNHLIHGYDNIAMGILWEAVTQKVPELLTAVENILREEGLPTVEQGNQPLF